MAITERVGHLASTLLALLQTRMALASVEIEEQSRRYLCYLLLLLLALFLAGLAIAMIALFVIVAFWDTHRLEAVAGTAVVLVLSSFFIGVKVRAGLAAGPRLLSVTMAEIRQDIEALRGAGADRSS
jgi:uncharacterized membrane protein YqjE